MTQGKKVYKISTTADLNSTQASMILGTRPLKDTSGKVTSYAEAYFSVAASGAVANAIVQRQSDSNIAIGDATKDNHAINKKILKNVLTNLFDHDMFIPASTISGTITFDISVETDGPINDGTYATCSHTPECVIKDSDGNIINSISLKKGDQLKFTGTTLPIDIYDNVITTTCGACLYVNEEEDTSAGFTVYTTSSASTFSDVYNATEDCIIEMDINDILLSMEYSHYTSEYHSESYRNEVTFEVIPANPFLELIKDL